MNAPTTGKKLTRVEKLIRAAFAELLQTKDFSKIRVSEIISKAEVSRSAFYAHYVDIYDLIGQIEQELFEGVQTRMQQVQASGTEYRTCRNESEITGKYESTYFEYIQEQRVWWELFMTGKGRADFVQGECHEMARSHGPLHSPDDHAGDGLLDLCGGFLLLAGDGDERVTHGYGAGTGGVLVPVPLSGKVQILLRK